MALILSNAQMERRRRRMGTKDNRIPTGPGAAELKEIQEKIQSHIVSQYPGVATTAKYTFAFQRHQDLVRALGLPECAVGTGYNYLKEADAPVEDFNHT